MTDIPPDTDADLHDIATRSANRYTDATITAAGWTRTDLIDAIHHRLRNKFAEMRDNGELARDDNGRWTHTT